MCVCQVILHVIVPANWYSVCFNKQAYYELMLVRHILNEQYSVCLIFFYFLCFLFSLGLRQFIVIWSAFALLRPHIGLDGFVSMTAEDPASSSTMSNNATPSKPSGASHHSLHGQINIPEGVAGAPNEAALVTLMERTGYTMVQENGQRKYGPPPGWNGASPPRGCEIFVGKIPRDVYEDELVPVFESVGRIYEMRLMMDFDGKNRGYAFVMYTEKHEAKRAVRELNNYEVRPGRLLGVCSSVDNCRLFIGGIPKTKKREEILEEVSKVTEGVLDVIVYASAADKMKNRGFAFVEYESHRAAAMARRKLMPGRIQLWGHQIAVDWAEPEIDVDEDVMETVKILYVRNLMMETSEETIRQVRLFNGLKYTLH